MPYDSRYIELMDFTFSFANNYDEKTNNENPPLNLLA